MIHYVVGFLFDRSKAQVLMINKQKPSWQLGYLNGLGGKIEPGEISYQAMAREFGEEAGVPHIPWQAFHAIGDRSTYHLQYFRYFDEEGVYSRDCRQMESEQIEWVPYDIRGIPQSTRCVSNAYWVLPMAFSPTIAPSLYNFSEDCQPDER